MAFFQRRTYQVTFSSGATTSSIVTPLNDVAAVAVFVSTGLSIAGGGTTLTVQVCNASSNETGGTAFYSLLVGVASSQTLSIGAGNIASISNVGFQQLRLSSTGAVNDGANHYAVATV